MRCVFYLGRERGVRDQSSVTLSLRPVRVCVYRERLFVFVYKTAGMTRPWCNSLSFIISILLTILNAVVFWG